MLILIVENCWAKGGEIIQLYKVLGVMGRGLLDTAFKLTGVHELLQKELQIKG